MAINFLNDHRAGNHSKAALNISRIADTLLQGVTLILAAASKKNNQTKDTRKVISSSFLKVEMIK